LARGTDIAIRAEEPRDPDLFGRKIADSQWAIYASKAYVARCGGIGRLQDLSDLVQVFGPVREVATPFYLLMHRDLRRTPHVRALFDFIAREIKTIRRILASDGKTAADRQTKT
jgi:DNA-binding transcriptional LysR family regulator